MARSGKVTQAPPQTGKQSAKHSSNEQSKATASTTTHRTADQKARRKNASVSGVERLQARRRRSILCSGRRGNMKAETIKRLTIKGWVALKLITAAVVCYQLECDALITSWGRSKKTKNKTTTKTSPHSNVDQLIQISISGYEKKSGCAVAALSSQNAEHEDLNCFLSPPTRQHNKCCSQQMQNCLAGRFIRVFFFSLRQATKKAFQKEKEKQQQQQKANLSSVNPCGAVKGGY